MALSKVKIVHWVLECDFCDCSTPPIPDTYQGVAALAVLLGVVEGFVTLEDGTVVCPECFADLDVGQME